MNIVTEQSIRRMGMRVAEAVGHALTEHGVTQVFGVVGSGNFFVTQAMVDQGARFVASRHEHGAAMMADAYGRLTGKVAVVSLHQGCGLTNAMTAITEAAKSHTPMLVVVGDTPPRVTTNNFWIEQGAALRALGVDVAHLYSPATAVADTVRALHRAQSRRKTVVLNMRVDIQEAEVEDSAAVPPAPVQATPPAPDPSAVDRIAELLGSAERPLIVAGRGGRSARTEIAELADATGALLATSAVARGIFADNPWSLDVMGGFASTEAADLMASADVILAMGASLNRWTARNGSLVRNATIVHVDDDVDALGLHREVDLPVHADAALTARAVRERIDYRQGWRSEHVRELIARSRWRNVPFEDSSTDELIDPRVATMALDELLPSQRVVVPDAGNMACYPAMFLSTPDERSFVLPLAFQSIGMALGAAIGAAVAEPERVIVAGIGDGAFMMSLAELDTAVRLEIPLVVIVYNDDAYGAEVHHFAQDTDDMRIVSFPETDMAAIAKGFGCDGLTVRTVSDLDAVQDWLSGERLRPLVIDLKVTSIPSWVLAHTWEGEYSS